LYDAISRWHGKSPFLAAKQEIADFSATTQPFSLILGAMESGFEALQDACNIFHKRKFLFLAKTDISTTTGPFVMILLLLDST